MIAPSATLAINVTLYKSLPYDPRTDFVPLALAAQTPFVLVVNPELPVRTVADLIKLAKDKPKQLSYASAGPGVPHHLFAELLKNMTGIEMTHVPYKGSLPALNDVVAGHVPLMFVDLGPGAGDDPGRQGAGDRRLDRAARLSTLPDVPPVGDTVPGFGAASWQMIVAPGEDAAADRRQAARATSRACSPRRSSRSRSARPAWCRWTAGRSPSCRPSSRRRSRAGARWCSRPASPDRNSTIGRWPFRLTGISAVNAVAGQCRSSPI